MSAPVLEQDPNGSPAQLEAWAIQSVMGETVEERQLAASCLLAAAKHWLRVATLRQEALDAVYVLVYAHAPHKPEVAP